MTLSHWTTTMIDPSGELNSPTFTLDLLSSWVRMGGKLNSTHWMRYILIEGCCWALYVGKYHSNYINYFLAS